MGYVCRQLELGRTGMISESKVKWEGSVIPVVPHIYYRTISTAAYAEFCAPGDVLEGHWPAVVAAAMAATEAVGLSKITENPTAALLDFSTSFQSLLTETTGIDSGKVNITLTTCQQPNEDWHE